MDSVDSLEGFKELVKGWLSQRFVLEFGRYPTVKELDKLMTYLYHNNGITANTSLKSILENQYEKQD